MSPNVSESRRKLKNFACRDSRSSSISNSRKRVHRGAKRPQRSGTQRVLSAGCEARHRISTLRVCRMRSPAQPPWRTRPLASRVTVICRTRVNEFTEERSDPSEAGRNASFSTMKSGKILKKTERTLDFSPIACKLCFGIAFLIARNPVSSSFQLVISAKGDENRPSLKQLFCSKVRNIPAGTIVSLCLACWAFFCSSFEQVLGRTFITAYGEASGFFYVQTLPRAQEPPIHPEASNVPVRSSHQSSSIPSKPCSAHSCRFVKTISAFFDNSRKPSKRNFIHLKLS